MVLGGYAGPGGVWAGKFPKIQAVSCPVGQPGKSTTNRLYSESQRAEDRFFLLSHNEVISSKDLYARPDSTTAVNSPFAVFSSYVIASAPSPCVKAASSNSGQFLVITGISPALAAGMHEIPVLTVYKKERFVNEKDRLTSPATYWGDTAQWTVVLKVFPK
jgi:hypothetical protein